MKEEANSSGKEDGGMRGKRGIPAPSNFESIKKELFRDLPVPHSKRHASGNVAQQDREISRFGANTLMGWVVKSKSNIK